MDKQEQGSRTGSDQRGSALFTQKTPERDELPINIWAIAALVVMVLVGAFLVIGRHKPGPPPNTILPLDPYAANLPISQLAMSESTSLSGGKSTFVDGHIRNAGGSTVTGITVQVLFHNDEGMPPLVETLPLALIRTREPYVDTEQVRVAPLKPGAEQEFRLIFETLPSNWNTQMPEIHLVRVEVK
jgi:hypothetical protein